MRYTVLGYVILAIIGAVLLIQIHNNHATVMDPDGYRCDLQKIDSEYQCPANPLYLGEGR